MAEGTYSTTDFYLTAVLISCKYKIQETTTEGPNGRVKRFHFEDTPSLRNTIMQYMNGDLEGNIREFRNSIETVKDMVHSG